MHEHAHHAKADPSLVPVTFTMALLAVLVAVVSLFVHRTSTHEVLLQSKASDQWAYFQAKNIRRHSYEVFAEVLAVTETKNPEVAAKLAEKYRAEAERYRDEQKDIEAEARQLEKEVDDARHEADRFELGEVLLEAALVVCSITILTSRRIFWLFGLAAGTAGLILAISGLWVH